MGVEGVARHEVPSLVIMNNLHLILQSTSLLSPCPPRAGHLCAGGGGDVLLLPLVAPQQEGVQAHPQAAPWVDCLCQSHLPLLPPCGAHPLQPAPSCHRSPPTLLSYLSFLALVQRGSHLDSQLPLRLPPPLPPLTRGNYFLHTNLFNTQYLGSWLPPPQV